MDNLQGVALTNPEILRVALDTPLRRLFDYLPAKEGRHEPRVGARVRVPFGRQRLVGVIHSFAASSELPREKLKPVLEVLDAEPVFDERVLGLLEFAAQYYHHPLGEVFASALPKLAREGASARALIERWYPSEAGVAALDANSLARAKRQRELLELLRAESGIASDTLSERFDDWRTPMRALVARGFVSSAEIPAEPPARGTRHRAACAAPGPH